MTEAAPALTASFWQSFSNPPLLWLSITLAVYLATHWLYQRSNGNPLLLPVLTGVIIIVALLWSTDTAYPDYFDSVRLLYFLIGPATVALAIPLCSQIARLRQMWLPLLVALLAGSATAVISALGIAWLFGGSLETIISLAPKSATIPIAMGVAERTGGLGPLAAVAVAVTGISGAMMAPLMRRLLHIDDPAITGFAIGVSAHAIGTSRAIQLGEVAGAFSALGMALNGIATALLVPLALQLLGWL